MTFEERVRGLEPLGFTPRQAKFVATVALHGGYCLRRHYATSASIGYGKNVRDFLEDLVQRQLAVRFTIRPDRGHLYHLHARPLYRLLGQEDNRNRRQGRGRRHHRLCGRELPAWGAFHPGAYHAARAS